MKTKKIALIGSTGSVGRQVLEVLERNPSIAKAVSLCANTNAELLSAQAHKYKPEAVCLAGGQSGLDLPDGVKCYYGREGAFNCITEDTDLVFVAVSGFAGLEIVLDAIEKKKDVALANKEALVAGGEIVMRKAKENGVKIIPVDSEHSAIWQCLNFREDGFESLILTASGGPFRGYTREQLRTVTPEQALRHPNWHMGAKITVDCATMLNKGFEVIEAHHLFNAPTSKIEVLIHPQSTVHSMVRFSDGSVMAEMSTPSMLQPIQIALTNPERLPLKIAPLDLASLGKLEFYKVEKQAYPCFDLAISALKGGGTTPCALNAASEVAVKAFLAGRIAFTDIAEVIEKTLSEIPSQKAELEAIKQTDISARQIATDIIAGEYIK